MANVTKSDISPRNAGGQSEGTVDARGRGKAAGAARPRQATLRAYEELVRIHQHRVLAVVGGILRGSGDVEDVAQQALAKAYFSIRRFDLRSAFGTWLYKIAVNECWDYLRKKKVRRLVYESDLSEEQVRKLESVPEQSFGGHQHREDAGRRVEQRQLIERLLGELEEKDQLMLVMKEVEGFSVEEIGEVLGLNVNTVKVRLFRARGRLVEMYRKRMQKRPLHASRAQAGKERQRCLTKRKFRCGCRKYEARLEDYLRGLGPRTRRTPGTVRELPRGSGEFAAGGRSDPPGLGTGRGAAPGVSGGRPGENSRGENARGIAGGVLESARIPGVAVVADGSRAAARSVRVSCRVCAAPYTAPPLPSRTELSASDFPQPPGDPVSNEEVLQSLAERHYGR